MGLPYGGLDMETPAFRAEPQINPAQSSVTSGRKGRIYLSQKR
jgi:hypothetical protein